MVISNFDRAKVGYDNMKAHDSEITAKAYLAAAELFEVYASDQIASKRFQSTARDKAACDVRASVWKDAAAELRKAATS